MKELPIKIDYEKRLKVLEEQLKQNPDDLTLIKSIEVIKKSLKVFSIINNNNFLTK